MYDIIIIGAGPAGITAAIYAARSNLNVLVIEGESLGGKLTKIHEIENYPGFATIGGNDLADHMLEHLKAFGVEIKLGLVKKIVDGETKKIILEDDEELESKSIIIATGTKEKLLDVPNSKEYIGKGISYCAVCDGFFYRKKDVIVVGGGNSAFQEALFLSSIANKVYIITRRDVFRADASIVEKAKNNEKIEIITKYLPKELVIENDRVKALEIENVDTKETKTIDCSGIFPYIGAIPNTSFVDLDILDEHGYVIVDDNMATKIPGIYGAGDVTNKKLRQVVTATNDGAIAANALAKYLK